MATLHSCWCPWENCRCTGHVIAGHVTWHETGFRFRRVALALTHGDSLNFCYHIRACRPCSHYSGIQLTLYFGDINAVGSVIWHIPLEVGVIRQRYMKLLIMMIMVVVEQRTFDVCAKTKLRWISIFANWSTTMAFQILIIHLSFFLKLSEGIEIVFFVVVEYIDHICPISFLKTDL